MQKKILIIGGPILLIAAFLAWLFMESSKPLPGEKIADLGREHIEIGKSVEYNSNPPTSGPHYADWIRAGVYEMPKDDRNLVHSLEHGYVIMHYRCHSERSEESQDSSQEIATSPAAPRNDKECEERKNQLARVYESKGKRKLIVVPRENLETNFALTAWNYLDKFNDFDEKRITSFIDAHFDQGPEKTME